MVDLFNVSIRKNLLNLYCKIRVEIDLSFDLLHIVFLIFIMSLFKFFSARLPLATSKNKEV